MNIGDMIRFYRKEAGLTQLELAELVDVKQYVITKYEKGIHQPNPEKLQKIAKALKISVQEFFSNEDGVLKKEKPSAKSRAVQMEKVYLQLKPEDQRAFLKQAKSVLKTTKKS